MNQFPRFEPLGHKALAESIRRRIDGIDRFSLEDVPEANGSGVYAIWYSGRMELYKAISKRKIPVYVRSAEPAGVRTGGMPWDSSPGKEICRRLQRHAESIRSVDNLDSNDFSACGLIVPPPFIRTAEKLMINLYGPPWNVAVDGFGKHAPGEGRKSGKRSWWDTIHPGRDYGEVSDSTKTLAEARRRIENGLNEARRRIENGLNEARRRMVSWSEGEKGYE